MQCHKAYIAAVLAPFFIAVNIIITKIAGTSADPLVIGGVSSLTAVPFLLVIACLAGKPLDCRKILNDLRFAFLQVLMTRSVVGQALIVTGFTLTTAVKAVLLLRLEPIFVFGWSVILLGEKPRAAKVCLLAALLLGSMMVVAPEGNFGELNLGDVLIVLSLLFFSFSYLPTQEIVKEANPAGLNILSSFVGGVVLTLIAAVSTGRAAFELAASTYALILLSAIIFTVIAASLYFYAFKTLRPWVIASFLSLEVVFGLALAAVVLHESINMVQFCGAVVLIAATVAIGRQPGGGDAQAVVPSSDSVVAYVEPKSD